VEAEAKSQVAAGERFYFQKNFTSPKPSKSGELDTSKARDDLSS